MFLDSFVSVFISISLNINIMACKSVLIKCQNVQKFLRRRNSQIKGSRSSIYAAFVEATTVGKHLIAEKFNCKCKRGDLRERAFWKRLVFWQVQIQLSRNYHIPCTVSNAKDIVIISLIKNLYDWGENFPFTLHLSDSGGTQISDKV